MTQRKQKNTLASVSGKKVEPKQQQLTMRADVEMVRELQELAELLSTEFVKASVSDALRAVVKVGAPILRERLEEARALEQARTAPPSTAPTRSTSAERHRKKEQ